MDEGSRFDQDRSPTSIDRGQEGAPGPDGAAVFANVLTRGSFAEFFGRGIDAGDVALGGAAAHAVLIEAARRLAGAIKPGNDLPVRVDHLAFRVDSQAGAAIVHHRSR